MSQQPTPNDSVGTRLPFDEEPEQHVPGSFLESLPQFFVFPLVLVATLTAAYLGLRLLVGFEPSDARDLIVELRSAPGEHARWQALHGLADGLRRGRLGLDEVSPAELSELYAGYAGESSEMRQFLLRVLAWKRAPELTSLVLAALEDEDALVRQAALFALGQMEDPAAVPALIEVLEGSSPDERFLALGALARVGTEPARDAIAGRLGGEDTILHRNAVLALAEAGDPRAADWMPALLTRESYADDSQLDGPDAGLLDEVSRLAAREIVVEEFLVNACRAAAHLHEPALVPTLQALRADDPSLKVRSAAINALHDLGETTEENS
jgi:hypothetical protein